jgi:hypothetical protein
LFVFVCLFVCLFVCRCCSFIGPLIYRRLFRSDNDDVNQSNEYFVKWCGLPYEDCTWESWKDISAFSSKVDEYRKRQERSNCNRSYIGYEILSFLIFFKKKPVWFIS